MRVLLVEDDVMIGEGLIVALSAEGMSVDWVRDGAAAEAVYATKDLQLFFSISDYLTPMGQIF